MKMIYKIFIRCFSLLLYKFIPTKKIVLIGSGMSSFDGCPKAIFEESLKHENNYKYICILKNKREYKILNGKYGKNVIYYKSIKGFINICFAKYLIVNTGVQDICDGLIVPKNRIVIQTFHGFIGKCFCLGAPNVYSKKEIKAQLRDCFNPSNTFIITGSKYEDDAYNKNCNFPYERMLRIGHPRNDILKTNVITRNDTLKKLGIPPDKKIILYSPTWREKEVFKFFPFSDFDISKLNSFLKINNYIMIVKLHPNFGNIDRDISGNSNIIMYDKNWNIDNNELFTATDLMITDYSSIYCDYLVNNKPVAFIQYDYEEFIKIRPLNASRETLYPGPLIDSLEEFKKNVKELIENKDYYFKEREKFYKLSYEYTNFKATKKVIEIIEKGELE